MYNFSTNEIETINTNKCLILVFDFKSNKYKIYKSDTAPLNTYCLLYHLISQSWIIRPAATRLKTNNNILAIVCHYHSSIVKNTFSIHTEYVDKILKIHIA